MSLDDVQHHAGADTRVLLEFVWLSMRVLGKYTVFAVLQLTTYLVASYYMYPAGLLDEDFDLADRGFLVRTNFGNLLQKDAGGHWPLFYSACWASVLGLYVLSWLTIQELKGSWIRVIDARQRQMSKGGDPSTRAVLIHGPLVSSHNESALTLWKSIYADKVEAIQMVRDTKKLPALLKTAFKLGLKVAKQERSLSVLRGKPNSDEFKQQSDAALARREAAIARAEEALKGTQQQHEIARAAAEAEYTSVNVPENDAGLSYFVLFRNRAATNIALQVYYQIQAHQAQVAYLPPTPLACHRLLLPQVFNTVGLRKHVMIAPHPAEVNWEFLTPQAVLRLKVTEPQRSHKCPTI